MINKNLKAAEDRQKSYADRNMLFKEFHVGEQVYLRIKLKKISLRVGACAKQAPRFCEPFSIIKRIGPIAYQLSLPPIVKFNDVFHVSLLKKYVEDVYHVLDWFLLQVEPYGEF